MIQPKQNKKPKIKKINYHQGFIMFKKLTLLLATLLALFTLLNCGADSESKTDVAKLNTKSATQTKTAVASFSASDLNGTVHQSSEWIGKQPVVINFWGTWCPPCRREIPELVKLYDEYRDKGVEIVSLAVRDTPEKVDKFTQANNMNWVMLMGDIQILQAMKATRGVPTTIFYDKDGNEKFRFVGARDYNTFKQAFESII